MFSFIIKLILAPIFIGVVLSLMFYEWESVDRGEAVRSIIEESVDSGYEFKDKSLYEYQRKIRVERVQ